MDMRVDGGKDTLRWGGGGSPRPLFSAASFWLPGSPENTQCCLTAQLDTIRSAPDSFTLGQNDGLPTFNLLWHIRLEIQINL